jgi:hypothetical protein
MSLCVKVDREIKRCLRGSGGSRRLGCVIVTRGDGKSEFLRWWFPLEDER